MSFLGRVVRCGSAATAIACIGASLLGAPVAVLAAEDQEESEYLIPTKLPTGVVVGDPAPEYRTEGNPPAEVMQKLLILGIEHPAMHFSATEWDPEARILFLYSSAEQSLVEEALSSAGLATRVQYRRAVRDYGEKTALAHAITGVDGSLPSGQRVVSVIPSLDGTSASVVLDETVAARSRAIGDRLQLEVPEGFRDVRIDVTLGAPTVPAKRAVNSFTHGGYVMRSEGRSCTTGFRMTQISGTVPVMGSAHHCFRGVENELWQYGEIKRLSGNATSIIGPGLSNGDVAIWKGPLADRMSPSISIGGGDEGRHLHAVMGAVLTPKGGSVCYSGSSSGTVCGNTVTDTGVTTCYHGGLQCYNDLVQTSQIADLPAAGKGDSGGPVYTTDGGIYASGVISGINSAGQKPCHGNPVPASKKCSSIVLFAPLSELMANGYGLNYYRP